MAIESGTWHYFLWDHGKVQDIGTLGGAFTTAHGLNDTGMIVGRSSVAQTCDSCTSNGPLQFSHPFVWKDNTLTDLGLPSGAQWWHR